MAVRNNKDKGILLGLSAYAFWGITPAFWKLLQIVPSAQLLAHRIVWSFLTMLLVVTLSKQWLEIKSVVRDPARLARFALSGVLLGINWFTFIWAVNSGYVLEASLGYYINPLTTVFLGVVILGERLRRLQSFAVVIAFLAVCYLSIQYGQVPWISLVLAGTFSLYSLIRKTTEIKAYSGLAIETTIMIVPAIAFLCLFDLNPSPISFYSDLPFALILALSGAVTAFPLVLFAMSARIVDLSVLGLMQYVAPTLQFLLAVLAYGEEFTPAHLVSFVMIWIALGLYSFDGVLNRRRVGVAAN